MDWDFCSNFRSLEISSQCKVALRLPSNLINVFNPQDSNLDYMSRVPQFNPLVDLVSPKTCFADGLPEV